MNLCPLVGSFLMLGFQQMGPSEVVISYDMEVFQQMLHDIKEVKEEMGAPAADGWHKVTDLHLLLPSPLISETQESSVAEEMAESGVTPALEERLKELRRPFRPPRASHEAICTQWRLVIVESLRCQIMFTHGTCSPSIFLRGYVHRNWVTAIFGEPGRQQRLSLQQEECHERLDLLHNSCAQKSGLQWANMGHSLNHSPTRSASILGSHVFFPWAAPKNAETRWLGGELFLDSIGITSNPWFSDPKNP